jgi:TetR/AcrR family transcriptional regulator
MAAEDRRQQIIDVAIQLFSQKGFRGTTTKEIAAAAGVNESIIFRHFTTKSELYAAIIDQKANPPDGRQSLPCKLEEAFEADDDRRLFETLAYTILDFHERDDTAMRLLFYSALEGHELADMIQRNHISKVHRRLADHVKKRIEDGVFRPMEPLPAVRCFMGMVMVYAMHKKFFRKLIEDEMDADNRQIASTVAEMFLSSMTNLEYQMTPAESEAPTSAVKKVRRVS